VEEILKILQAMKDTSVPAMLVGGGILFLFIAVGGRLGATVTTEGELREKAAAIIGVFLLLAGMGLYAIPPEGTLNPKPTSIAPTSDRPTATTQSSDEPAASSFQVFKLGILGPFSGSESFTGDQFKGAVKMAFDAVDWQIANYDIEPVWIDSESDPDEAAHAYERAITQDGVQAGLLNWHSSVAVRCMDVVAEYEIPHFAGLGATGAVNDAFNGDRNTYGYWTTKWWPRPGKLSTSYVQMLEHAIDSGHWSPSGKTVAIYSEETGWGRAFSDGVKANFEDAGWRVVAEEYFTYGQTDFTMLMEEFSRLGPVVVAGTTTSKESATAFINQVDAREMNSVIILDGLSWTEGWYKDTGDSSNYVVDQIPGWTSDESQAFKQTFEDRYSYSPSLASGGLVYDAANFFINVAQATYEQYGELTSESLYSFTRNQIWTGQWTYTDGIMMEEYKYTLNTIPDPVVGTGYYMFPVVQYFDGEYKIIFPPDWVEQAFTPPGG
jgi:branched-chain amino acid transport system substrate-binding protein